MKKLLTLGAALLASFSLWAAYPTATTTYALEDLTVDEPTLTYSKTGLSGDAQKLKNVLYIDVEVPCASANGNLYLRSSSSNTGRFATIWGSNGTARDESRKVAMKNGNSDAIAFTADDILEDNGKYYIRFSSADNAGSYYDYKITGFSYTLNEECVTKEVDHVEVTLNGVAVNGDEIESPEVDPLFYGSHTLNLTREFVEAPTVTFIKQTDTYYVGEATPSTKNDSIHVVATGLTPTTWVASYTLNTVTYKVSAIKPATATVTYMDGETVLGTETVKKGDPATKYGEYEVKPLAVFAGWYMDAELTNPVDMATYAINNDLTVHGWFVKSYAESVNFENNVMNNGKSFDIIGLLGTSGYATDITGSLDSLDNSKTDGLRNYAYLGLKVKQNGATLNFWIGNGSTVKIKFGNIAKTPLVSINGGEYADMSITDKVYTHTAAADELISIKMADASAVVFQQIMIDEELRSPELFAINCAEATNGTVAAYKLGIPNETITLTVTPDAGYKTATVTVNGDELVDVEGAYSFTMPGQDVDVVATFEVSTGVSDAAADADATKPTKRLVDGVLLIEKDGVTYSAQGGILK
ncbi:MAG: hypothetical protein K5633_05575 [Paludibacteraceae bacterium]|nr:hypothetical protein [Paludibacteraceae bacterium]